MDCNCPLNILNNSGDNLKNPNKSSKVFASLKYRVWICVDCTKAHFNIVNDNDSPIIEVDGNDKKKYINLIDGNLETLKPFNDIWNENELSIMENAISNIEVNKIYEKYLDHYNNTDNITKIPKINSNSNDQDRLTWVLAKYSAHLFCLPLYLSLETNTIVSRISAVPKTLPNRIVDYFLTVEITAQSLKTHTVTEMSIYDIPFNPVVTGNRYH